MSGLSRLVLGASIASSFTLYGNAFTQCFMSVPALLVDFPEASSSSHPERARLLGRQWPVFWEVGNWYFRPISMLGTVGYFYTAWVACYYPSHLRYLGRAPDWIPFAASALCHAVTVVHSAINMQPLNNKLQALDRNSTDEDGKNTDGKDDDTVKEDVQVAMAEQYALAWIRGNVVRLVTSGVAGSLSLWQLLRVS